MESFPSLQKKLPDFENPIPGTNGNQVLRKGKKKIGFVTVNVIETFELNDEGMIPKITAPKGLR